MANAVLSHGSLRRVLQSLIGSTYKSLRASCGSAFLLGGQWKDCLSMAGHGRDALGCDSLDLLHLSAAVNEMFHLHEAGLETKLLQQVTFGAWLDVIEQAWREGIQHLTVTTSGSTGLPKGCTHELSTLALEIDFLATLFRGRSRVVAFTPAHHLYGLLFTAMLPDRLACSLQDFWNHSDTSGGLDRTTLKAGDLIVTFPDGWAWIDKNVRDIPPDVQGVVSAAPCPPPLVESLARHKLSRLTEVYGSSETAGIGTRTWPAKTYSLMPQWTRKDSGTAESKLLRHSSGFELEPLDDLEFFPDNTFLVHGRIDLGVQVGGVNVFPALIAQRLVTHPGVEEASVRLMRAEEGNRLKCFVVPAAGYPSETLTMLLQEWIQSWPTASERPKSIKVGSALPRGPSGKNSDW